MRRLGEYGLCLMVAALMVWWALARKAGSPGWVRVRPHEVAVVSDYVRGTRALVATPGVRWFVPYFQDVHVLDRSPAEFRMHGSEATGDRDVSALVVRAADGTTFSFEDLTLRYQLAVDQAPRALEDSGDRERARFLLVRALASGVLRDELGRYSSQEIVVGANFDAARTAARERLNARLAPHGLYVHEIPAATPRFDGAYEQQVLRRRVAEQQIELVAAEREKLAMELEQRRARVLREVEAARAQLVGELAGQRIAAETAAVKARGEADRYHLERLGAGERERARLEAQAAALGERYAREAEAFAERMDVLVAQGEQAVREAWIETLGGIELELVPYELQRPEASAER